MGARIEEVGQDQLQWISRAQTLLAGLFALSLLWIWLAAHVFAEVPLHASRYDPEIVYMISSLGIFKSHPYAYIDHPGTPIELIGTFELAVMRFFGELKSDAYWLYILQNPEAFLRVSDGFLTVVSMVTMFLLVRFTVVARRWMDLLLAAAIGAVFYASLPMIPFSTLVSWSHNSFNFAFGTLLWLVIWLRLRKENVLQGWEVVLFGLAAGILTAVQLYFGAWVVGIAIALGIFIWLQERQIGRTLLMVSGFVGSSIIGFIIATLPIIHKYREFAWWVRRLIFRQGRYGSGPAGILSRDLLGSSFRTLWDEHAAFFVILVIALVLLALATFEQRRFTRKNPAGWAVAIGSVFQAGLTLLAVLKHPAGIYLLAVAALLPILYAIAFTALRKERNWVLYFSIGISAIFVIDFGVNYARSMGALQAQQTGVIETRTAIEEVKANLAEEMGTSVDELRTLWGYGTYSECYALRFGDFYSEGVFSEEIDRLCPNDFVYDVWSHQASLPGGPVELYSTDGWDLLVIRKGDLSNEETGSGDVVALGSGPQVAVLRSMEE